VSTPSASRTRNASLSGATGDTERLDEVDLRHADADPYPVLPAARARPQMSAYVERRATTAGIRPGRKQRLINFGIDAFLLCVGLMMNPAAASWKPCVAIPTARKQYCSMRSNGPKKSSPSSRLPTGDGAGRRRPARASVTCPPRRGEQRTGRPPFDGHSVVYDAHHRSSPSPPYASQQSTGRARAGSPAPASSGPAAGAHLALRPRTGGAGVGSRDGTRAPQIQATGRGRA
jgi:hypothetical protein